MKKTNMKPAMKVLSVADLKRVTGGKTNPRPGNAGSTKAMQKCVLSFFTKCK